MGRFYRDSLGVEQQRIYQKLVNGANVFLTGNAGTGKSFLVEAYNEYCEENGIKLLKAAPTGVAACNIEGVTLHKLFNLKTDVRSMLKEEKALPENVKNVLNLASAILIDEISMVRLDVFDKIMRYIEMANAIRREQKRKELQLVFVGDFYQLSPVIPPEDKKALNLYYGKDVGNAFAFQSKYWQSLNVQFEKLTEVRRQDGDKPFCTALDQCKEGDDTCLKFFMTQTAKKESSKAIWVCGRNDTAAAKNLAKLASVKGEEQCVAATYSGEASAKDKMCEETFQFKTGARVLMLINEPTNVYQNGSMGTIKSVSESGIWVDIDQKDSKGKALKSLNVLVEKHDFCKFEYVPVEYKEEVKDERGEVQIRTRTELELKEIGKATQYPMKLGFAITVHKAQGQTYDEMNLVPEIFQDGQLYVALSRCRLAKKLYISEPLTNRMVRASQEVVNYYKNPENYSFFGKEQDIVSVQVSRECEGAVKLLNSIYGVHKAEILDFLSALEKKKQPSADSVKAPVVDETCKWGEAKQMSLADVGIAEPAPTPKKEAFAIADEPEGEPEQLAFPCSEDVASNLPFDFESFLGSSPAPTVSKMPNTDIIVFDTETTGLSSENDRLTEIGAVMVRNHRIVDSFDTFVNPKRELKAAISQLTGITDAMLADAPDEAEAMEDFIDFCGDNVTLLAYNAPFDDRFIQATCRRLGIKFSYTLIDVLDVCRRELPMLKSHKLADVAKHLGFNGYNAHRAVDDAEMTALVYLKLTESKRKAV